MLPKPNRDPTSPKFYRPIALLNQDAKIFTAAIVNHLKKIITNYISKDLMDFIPKCTISDNIWRTLDLILYHKNQPYESIVLVLDIEKAFDIIEPRFMTSLLEEMGFGNKFLTVIHALY